MGLPGSGKTYLAERLVPRLEAVHFNADIVRKEANDWDFSPEGRLRQAKRMAELADKHVAQGKHVVVDFVCPTKETRELFNPDITIWVDTITEGRFEDTNRVFETPDTYDIRVTDKTEGDFWAIYSAKRILEKTWETQHPTTQLLGRWQPWHEGHRALFDRAIRKTGQVVVMVRDCHGLGDNPFVFEDVRDRIKEDLDGTYIEGVDYVVHHVPNIVHITYGRTVGYTIEQEHLGEALESVSATKKREELRSKGELRKP
jgi:adenylylsulfate kinase